MSAATAHRPDCVAVFNTSDDVIELLRIVLEQAGFAVVVSHIVDIKKGNWICSRSSSSTIRK